MSKAFDKIVAIVGLGLIGGSFAKATKAYTESPVYGYDKDVKTLDRALKEGVIDRVLDNKNIEEADIIFLAVRPGIAVEFVRENTNIRGLLIDLCGVKKSVSRDILPLAKKHNFKYIGGHPMAGKEVGGYDNSSPNLFRGASMILVPHGEEVEEFLYDYFTALGFDELKLSDDDSHDRILAFTSQLPHIVSNAFVKSERAKEHFGYSADSLKDLTRVATLDEEMWTELFMKNKDYLINELAFLIKELNKYKDSLEEEDWSKLQELLKEGKDAKNIMYPKGEARE